MGDLAAILYTYGGWGISAVCFFAIWRMAKYIIKTHEQQRADDKAVAAAQREETRETITVLVETRNALAAFKGAIEALDRKLEARDAGSG
jgi:hypothetical protein